MEIRYFLSETGGDEGPELGDGLDLVVKVEAELELGRRVVDFDDLLGRRRLHEV